MKKYYLCTVLLSLFLITTSCSVNTTNDESIKTWDDVVKFITNNYGLCDYEDNRALVIYDSINEKLIYDGIMFVPDTNNSDDFWIQISHNYGFISQDNVNLLLSSAGDCVGGGMVVILGDQPNYIYRMMVKGKGLKYKELKEMIDYHMGFVRVSRDWIPAE